MLVFTLNAQRAKKMLSKMIASCKIYVMLCRNIAIEGATTWTISSFKQESIEVK